jgi:hypothetical protein
MPSLIVGSKYDSPTMEIAGHSGINAASLDVIKTENLYILRRRKSYLA